MRAQLTACLAGIVCQPSSLPPTALASARRGGDPDHARRARAHIRSGETHQLRNDYRLAELGSMSLDQALAEAVALGRLDKDVALGVCRDPEAFAQFLRVRTGPQVVMDGDL